MFMEWPYSVDASSGPDLFLTGLSAFHCSQSSHGREAKPGSESHQSRIILSARVPAGANAISQDDEARRSR